MKAAPTLFLGQNQAALVVKLGQALNAVITHSGEDNANGAL